MSADAGTLAGRIMGREFRVACAEGERAGLLEAVSYLDARMCEIRDAGRVTSTERIAVMAALNMAHELLRTRVAGGVDLGELRRRIVAMQEAADAALSSQDKLF